MSADELEKLLKTAERIICVGAHAVGQPKTIAKSMKDLLRKQILHRRKWDEGGYKTMAQLGHFRRFQAPKLYAPWVAESKDSVPDESTLKGPISDAIQAKMKMTDLVENSADSITPGQPWPDS